MKVCWRSNCVVMNQKTNNLLESVVFVVYIRLERCEVGSQTIRVGSLECSTNSKKTDKQAGNSWKRELIGVDNREQVDRKPKQDRHEKKNYKKTLTGNKTNCIQSKSPT